MQTKYDFDPERCKRSIEKLADLTSEWGLSDRASQVLSDTLDDLIMDIEDLHRAAQARDRLLEAMNDLPIYETNSGELVPLSAIDDLFFDFKENPEYHEIADLNL